MAGFSGLQRRLDGRHIAHFTDDDIIRVMAHRGPNQIGEVPTGARVQVGDVLAEFDSTQQFEDAREARAKADNISVDQASKNLLAEKQPQLQFTKPEQIAGLAVFLASDTASNMQGTQLVSDGGWTAQ